MTRTALAEYLAEHPRTIGILFAATILLAEAGSAMANGGIMNSGP